MSNTPFCGWLNAKSGCVLIHEVKVKVFILRSQYPSRITSRPFSSPRTIKVGTYSSLQLLIQSWICTPGTHYNWVDKGSVGYKAYPTLLHMTNTGNQILSPMPYPPGHRLPHSFLSSWMQVESARDFNSENEGLGL